MAGARRLRSRMFRKMLFILALKGFQRKNFLFLLVAAVVIVFQVIIVSRVLVGKTFSRRWSIYRVTSINSTTSAIDHSRINEHENMSFARSLPALTRPSQLKAKRPKHRRLNRTRKQNRKRYGNDSRASNTNKTLDSIIAPTLDYRILYEYYPPVNFSVVIPHVAPEFGDKDIYLLVLVNSATAKNPNAKRRQAIRKTWGDLKTLSNMPIYGSIKHGFSFRSIINHSVRLVFLVGKSDNDTLNEEIEEEAKTYNDLVIGNFRDMYNNLIIKVYMGFNWAEKLKCRFILKGDDDTYIYLPRLMTVLNQAPVRFFGGYVMTNAMVFRDISDKHAISKMYYKDDYYPPYCGGGFYIFSHNLIPQFISLTKKFKPFHVEDAYLGILLRDMGIRPLFMPGFHLTNWMASGMHNFNPCDWATAIALGHKFNSSDIQYVHSKFQQYEPSRLSAREWQACNRKLHAAIPDNMLPTVYGILITLAMILVYVTVAFLPSQYEYEEDKTIYFKKRRPYYYPFVYRSTR